MENRTIILRLIAGGYVFYLGLQLLTGYINGNSEGNPMVSIAGGVLFLLFGALCVISAIRGFWKNANEIPVEEPQGDAVEIEDAEESQDEL